MSASMEFNFGQARRDFNKIISKGLEEQNFETCSEYIKSYKGSDSEKKLVTDQTLRDYTLNLDDVQDCTVYKKITSFAVELAKADLCATSLPILLLSDIFDVITLDQCEELFNLVEDNLSTWKSELFFDAGKNFLLRMCNDLLRRLSKSQNTVFCGRIQLFLSRLFPLSEKSALNLMSQFNLDNVTTYTTQSSDFKVDVKEEKMEVEEGEMDEVPSIPVDYKLYRRFWALQDYFRKPSQCYEKIPWKSFQQNSEAVLKCFASSKLDDMKSSRRKLAMPRTTDTSTYFAKYLTSEKLLDLQLNDSNFRRYVLVQFLILFQYLNSQVKFKSASQQLGEEQSQWVRNTQEQVYQLIKETPPDGEVFAKTVEHTLEREEHWNKWKNDGCPSYELEKQTAETQKQKKAKRKWVGDDLQATGGKIIKMGSSELTKLWNLNPNNMDACKAESRVFLPELQDYFSEAIEQADPDAMIEESYKLVNNQTFQWKSLRLLARRSPHFFSNTNQPAIPLPQYLDIMLKKIAQEIPQANNAEEMKTGVEEEEEIKETQDEDELKQNGENGKDEEEGMTETITKETLDLLSKKLGAEWKKLATELNFPEDDISYFESETSDEVERALKMLTIWQENEGDRATAGTLKISLKEVGLTDVIEAVFGTNT